MVKSTEDILRAACRSDSTITPEQVRAALDVLRGRVAVATPNAEPLDRPLSRETVAALFVRYEDGDSEDEKARKLKRAAKRVDALCRRGALRRIYADGTRRAVGISEASYRAFCAKTAGASATGEGVTA